MGEYPRRGPNDYRPNRLDPPLTHAELTEYYEDLRSCIRGAVWKCGLPFAAFVHVVSKFKDFKGNINFPAQNKSINPAWSVLKVFAHVVIGTMLYTPVCNQRIYVKMMNRKAKFEPENQTEDKSNVDYSSSLTPIYSDHSDREFSHLNLDLNQPIADDTDGLILEDDKNEAKLPSTTYEALRKQNRDSFFQKYRSQIRTDKLDKEQVKSPYSISGTEKDEPPKNYRKNKYGDDIEF